MVLLKKIYNKIVNYNGKVINYLSNSFIAIKYRQQQYRICMDALNSGDIKKARDAVESLLSSVNDWRMLKSNTYALRAVSNYARHISGITSPCILQNTAKESHKFLICADVIKAGISDPHLILYCNIASGLVNYRDNIEVFLVATHERGILKKPHFPKHHSPDNQDIVKKKMEEYVGKEFSSKIHLIYMNETGIDGFINTCQMVMSINPDVVLYAGGVSNESRLLRHTLYNSVPTALFFCKCTNDVDNMVDVVIPRSNHKIIGSVESDKIIIQPYPLHPNTLDRWSFRPSREQNNTVNNPKKIVSGLRGKFKTGFAVNSETATQLLRIVDETPDSVWYLIGASKPDSFINSHSTLRTYAESGKVEVLPFVEDYEAFLSDADLYLHLPGLQGGGGSASIARRQGVPVLCFRESDVASMQPECSVFDDDQITDYVDYAIMLLQDQGEHRKLIDFQYDHVKNIVNNAPGDFYRCLVQATENFLKRNKAERSTKLFF